jgi:signal peptidase I
MVDAKIKSFKGLLWMITVLVSLSIVLRIFFVAIYQVPSSSMEPTLLPGDIILVSKTTYGPRLLKCYNYLRNGKYEYLRHQGLSTIKKNDVVVFNMPFCTGSSGSANNNEGECIVKRIYGVPGEIVLIDNTEISNKGLVQFRVEDYLFPHDSSLHWTLDKYGPLYVPAKDSMVRLTKKNICFYKDILQYENKGNLIENIPLARCDSLYQYYSFKHNYYFMLGDNFYSSYDSRYWGFVSEENIIGKAVLVLISVNSYESGFKKIRFNRFFKKIQ